MGHQTHFKAASREDVLAHAEPRKGATLYVAPDPWVAAALRMTKAVKGEGLPTLKNPFVHGNLFLILNIEFPDKLTEEAREAIDKVLPRPIKSPSIDTVGDDVEVHELTDLDPVSSYQENAKDMDGASEAYDEDVGSERRQSGF